MSMLATTGQAQNATTPAPTGGNVTVTNATQLRLQQAMQQPAVMATHLRATVSSAKLN